MEIAISTFNIDEEIEAGKLDLFEAMKQTHEMGFDAIEFLGNQIPSLEDDYLERLKLHGKKLNLKICAIDVVNRHFGSNDFERKNDISLIKFWIKTAAQLECPFLVAFLGGFEEEKNRKMQLRRDIDAFKECVEFAEKSKVRLAIENHRIWLRENEWEQENETDDILLIVKTINSKYLGASPDIGNFYKSSFKELSVKQQEYAYNCFEQLISVALHIHIKIKNFDEHGKSLQSDFGKLVNVLKKYNYNRTVTLEFAKPVAEKKDVLHEQGLALLKKYI